MPYLERDKYFNELCKEADKQIEATTKLVLYKETLNRPV